MDLDWYNDSLQAMVFDKEDEPAVYVRFEADGTISEILVRDELKDMVHSVDVQPTDWQDRRDRTGEFAP